MPPTLRLWAASGTEVFRAAYGCQAHSAAITPRASILSRIFSPLFICLFRSRWEVRPLRTSKSAN